MTEPAAARPPEQLAGLLRPFIPEELQAELDALLAKAVHSEQHCDICYAAAKAEGAASVRITDLDGPVLGFCPHGVNLDRDFCPHGCRA